MQRATWIACAVQVAWFASPASWLDQPNSVTATGTPTMRASAGTSNRSIRDRGARAASGFATSGYGWMPKASMGTASARSAVAHASGSRPPSR